MPAKAGIRNRPVSRCLFKTWIPAFAGMTMEAGAQPLRKWLSKCHSVASPLSLYANPGIKGKIVLVLTIQPTGQVSSVVVKSSELNAPELEASLLARIRQLDFGKRPGGPLTVTIPVEFLPS